MNAFVRRCALAALILHLGGAAGVMNADLVEAKPRKAKIVVKNPRHAKVVKRGVTKSGHYRIVRYSRKVYVIKRPGKNPGWKRTVFIPRHRKVVGRWQTKRSKCVRYNMRVPGGKGRGHRFKCRPKISRETRMRRRIVAVAKASLSSRTGFYRYSQAGRFSFDPTPPWGYRTDCSQWTAAVYKKATGRFIGYNTWDQDRRGRTTRNPKPGDLFLSPGHVELYVGHGRTIGHGSAPIDYARTSYFRGHFVTFFR